jgi:lanthanide-dependent methanol dehydrogenase
LWNGGNASTAHAAAGAEWTTPSGDVQGTRYSSLAQITAANVSTLVEEFSTPTITKNNHEGQPLVIGQTMYVVTPYPNKLIALALRTPGRVLWTFNPEPREYAQGVASCDVVNRGAAYANGKIIYTLLDDSVVAVNATTGVQVWRTRLGNPRTGETLTGAPIIVRDKVIVGNAGGELGIRGWVQALNVNTGALVWKAYNTGPDVEVKIGANFHVHYAKDRGTNLGSSSWPGTLWKQGGANAWAWFTYDPTLNLVYYGTANPGVWNPDMRPGDNKWGATIFARNPDTGEAVWAYQVTPHDGWDFDAISESIVVNLTIGGVTRRSLVHFDKNGFAYTMDAATGEVLLANKFAHVTWAQNIDLTTGAPLVLPGMDPHEGVITKNICPSPLGGKEFSPAAYSPRTKLFYVPGINFCQDFEPLRALYISGTPFLGADIKLFPGPGGFMGELIAWNAANGTKKWSIKEPFPLYGGILATAGDVVFYGTLDRWFKAVNATTGQVLFKKQLQCGIAGNPISYSAPDGTQRIAVYSGTGWLNGGFAGGACPGDGDEDATPTRSGRVHVFKLKPARNSGGKIGRFLKILEVGH